MTLFGKVQPATSFDTVLYGTVNRPAIIVVGVWDPLVLEHQALLSEMVAYAHARDLAAVTVLLDPAPPQFLLNDPWPVFEPLLTRIERMQRLGIDGIMVVSFTPHHLATSAALFLASVSQHITIAELWLGARQIFGRREPGSLEAILTVARTSGFEVRHLEQETDMRRKALQVRIRLASGCIAAAREIVGHSPIYARSAAEVRRLAWASGVYQIQLLDSLDAPPEPTNLSLLTLPEDTKGYSRFTWPAPEAPYLAFIRGPYDIHKGGWEPEVAPLAHEGRDVVLADSDRRNSAAQVTRPCGATVDKGRPLAAPPPAIPR